ncbi:MAG TPA: class I SAM-dependent methyltransferase [Thermoleophilia bacterium]|nr:class I SAM-dependent methyltransferase [Thermoleophilia bacterium]
MASDHRWPARPPRVDGQKWVRFLLGDKRIRGLTPPPLPDAATQAKFVGSCGAESFKEASTFCEKLYQVATAETGGLQADTPVLDFGVGWGRLYRVMLNYVGPNCLIGSDIDPSCVELCSEEMPYGTFVHNDVLPPLDFPPDEFAIVYAYSVFSHLAPSIADGWMKEFSRIVRRGGLVAFTTLKTAHLSVWASQLHGDDPNYVACLERSGFDRDAWDRRTGQGEALYLPIGGGDMRDGAFYGETILSEPAVRHMAHRAGLRLLLFEDGPDLPQSFVVFGRP